MIKIGGQFLDLLLEDNLKNGVINDGILSNFFSNHILEIIDKKGKIEFFEVKEFEGFKVIY